MLFTFPCQRAWIYIATIFIHYRSRTDSKAKLQPGSLSYSYFGPLISKFKSYNKSLSQCHLILRHFPTQTIQWWSLPSPFSGKWWPVFSRWSSKCFLLHPGVSEGGSLVTPQTPWPIPSWHEDHTSWSLRVHARVHDHPKGIGIVGGNFNELDDQLHVPSHLLLALTHPCHVVISIYSSHEFSVLWCHFWTLKLDLPMECATFLLCPVLDNLHRFCCRMNERQKIDSFGVLPDSGNQFMELPP